MKKTILWAFVSAALLIGCQESMEQRTLRETQEYTEKHCPEKLDDFTILDSLTFDVETHTLTEHLTLTNGADSPEKISQQREELQQIMINGIRNDTNHKKLKDAGYSFRFIARGEHNKSILYEQTITKEDYR